ncbi:MAG: leucine--tRNA ligase [Phycisphaerales bacterium]|nr:leucine--tRNA ligase [Planctomycetota bacterium]MBL6996991.1 leucine--tRNA ligase [Phycisphaerales bacterium]
MTSKPQKTVVHRYCAEVASELETRWQGCWKNDAIYSIGNPGDQGFDESKPKFYCLDMFPYPSGEGLHVGHPVGYIGSDIISRFKRMSGYNVLHPMGWDAFGLPAEQYAIETGVHPAITTKKAIDTFRGQLQRIGFCYDWSREFATIDPNYYKWTQWIWLKAYNSWFDPKSKTAKPIQTLLDALDCGEIVCEPIPWESMGEESKRAYIDDHRLAYLGMQVVNWCPKLGTVLANEEVIDGKSERGDHPVFRRPLKQWMFRITAFADRLLEDLDTLDWPQSTLRMQQEWIGRSEGADIDFTIPDCEKSIRVYTTRPDTLFGVTFMVLAPEHPLVDELIASPPKGCNGNKLSEYVKEARNRADVDRMADTKEKTGVFSGLYATNPATGNRIPVWIADYVLMGYGHGAIMAVPAHDQRDHDFAEAHDIEIVEVVKPNIKTEGCFSGHGTAINSSSDYLSINGLQTPEAKQKIITWLEENNIGVAKINYRLRDWLFSRQRYWGEPFPIVFDGEGKHYPISEHSLPVKLPNLEDYTPAESDTPQPLLAKATDWLHTTAGEAGVDPSLLPPDTPVTRETNTMPGWAGSCWYEIRFCSPHDNNRFVDKDSEKYWMGGGIDLYVGGAEHAVLHLLYARFWHKLLFDLGEVTCNEPFQKLFHQGMLTSYAYQRKNKSLVASNLVEERNDSFYEIETGEELERVVAKMSKSLRNVVNPDDVISEYGADTLRLYEMYMGPLEASAPWNTRDIVGVHRFLQRVWRLVIDESTGNARESLQSDSSELVERSLHATIAKVTQDIPKLSYNTAIASMIEFVNTATSAGTITANQADSFVRLLSPFAPHISQELFSKIGRTGYVSNQSWPEFNPEHLVADVVEMPVQIMGKVRGRISVPTNANDKQVEKCALENENISQLLENLTVRKVIVVPNKIINIVAN